MKQAEPIIITHLFPEILNALLDLLSGLSDSDWNRPAVRTEWSVRDVALHLLGGDVGVLSRGRDRYLPGNRPTWKWEELVVFINELNDVWLRAARRISPRLLCDLLQFTGSQVCSYFSTLDAYATGGPVDWAGSEPAPVWLDLAREYTERWHHQQQIREATGRPGLIQTKYLKPVLDTFIRALPHAYRGIEAREGALMTLTLAGDSGGTWSLLKEQDQWRLYAGRGQEPLAEVQIPQDIAWRLFTKGVNREEAVTKSTILGDRSIGLKVFDMVSVIA
jgi:hypothetical protein